jgi:hypothetical protein
MEGILRRGADAFSVQRGRHRAGAVAGAVIVGSVALVIRARRPEG